MICRSYQYILIQVYQLYLWTIFSLNLWLIISFFNDILGKEDTFNFNIVQFIIIFLCVLSSYLKNSIQRLHNIFLCFVWKFYTLAFMFRFIYDKFQINGCVWCQREGWGSFFFSFFHTENLFFQDPVLKKFFFLFVSLFFPVMYLDSFIKS